MDINDPSIRLAIFEVGLACRATAAGIEAIQGRADCAHIAGELRLLHQLVTRGTDAADTVLSLLWGDDSGEPRK
jgi:hypothetical protein